ncbi:MAG: TRAP transporter TatT component family protein [Spirochaetota bacterium]
MKRQLLAASVLTVALLNSCAVFSAIKGIQTAFMSESDPELAAAALPTLIKVQEGLLSASPEDQGTIVATAQLYVTYGNAFIQAPAEGLSALRWEEKRTADFRARALYKRASVLLLPALERRAPGILGTFKQGSPGQDGLPQGATKLLSRYGKPDLALLYWSSASLLAAFSVDPTDIKSSSSVGLAKALLDRALLIDPAWDFGSLQELALSVYGSFPPELGGDPAKALAAYKKGMDITKGQSPSLLVGYAGTICVANDDYAGFRKSLEAALAIDPDARPESRLATVIAQGRARRMLSQAGDIFLIDESQSAPN